MKFDIKNPNVRVKVMDALQDKLDAEVKARPDKWGKISEKGDADDNFVVARFFVNSDRDKNMVKYLDHHLMMVYLATIGACILFMHPIYGLLTGIFLAAVMCQVQGIMAFFDVPLDIVSFAVMVMGIGFAIEYVVHIAHAFLHCEGNGLTRTRNALEEMGLTVFSAFLHGRAAVHSDRLRAIQSVRDVPAAHVAHHRQVWHLRIPVRARGAGDHRLGHVRVGPENTRHPKDRRQRNRGTGGLGIRPGWKKKQRSSARRRSLYYLSIISYTCLEEEQVVRSCSVIMGTLGKGIRMGKLGQGRNGEIF